MGTVNDELYAQTALFNLTLLLLLIPLLYVVSGNAEYTNLALANQYIEIETSVSMYICRLHVQLMYKIFYQAGNDCKFNFNIFMFQLRQPKYVFICHTFNFIVYFYRWNTVIRKKNTLTSRCNYIYGSILMSFILQNCLLIH